MDKRWTLELTGCGKEGNKVHMILLDKEPKEEDIKMYLKKYNAEEVLVRVDYMN